MNQFLISAITTVGIYYIILLILKFIFKILKFSLRFRKTLNEIPYNLNEIVKIKLTDKGYQHLADKYNSENINNLTVSARDLDFYRAKADYDGYTSMPVWIFMKYFGSVMQMGSAEYFSIDVLFFKSNKK